MPKNALYTRRINEERNRAGQENGFFMARAAAAGSAAAAAGSAAAADVSLAMDRNNNEQSNIGDIAMGLSTLAITSSFIPEALVPSTIVARKPAVMGKKQAKRARVAAEAVEAAAAAAAASAIISPERPIGGGSEITACLFNTASGTGCIAWKIDYEGIEYGLIASSRAYGNAEVSAALQRLVIKHYADGDDIARLHKGLLKFKPSSSDQRAIALPFEAGKDGWDPLLYVGDPFVHSMQDRAEKAAPNRMESLKSSIASSEICWQGALSRQKVEAVFASGCDWGSMVRVVGASVECSHSI